MGDVSLLSFYLFITVLVRSQAVAAAWAGRYSTAHETLGEIPYHIWRRPYIHEYMPSIQKGGTSGFWGAGGTQRNFLVNLDDVHTFRLTIKYLQNFSSAHEGHCTLNEICVQIEDSTLHVKFLKMSNTTFRECCHHRTLQYTENLYIKT